MAQQSGTIRSSTQDDWLYVHELREKREYYSLEEKVWALLHYDTST
jgi:hypothetical protein